MGIHSWTIFTVYLAGATVDVGTAGKLAGRSSRIARRTGTQTIFEGEKGKGDDRGL